MASRTYYEKMLALLRPHLSSGVLEQAHRYARGHAGGRAYPREEDHVAALMDAAQITPERLADQDDDGLGSMHRHMHGLMRQASNKTPYKNSLKMIYGEMSKRGMKCLQCGREAKKLSEIKLHLPGKHDQKSHARGRFASRPKSSLLADYDAMASGKVAEVDPSELFHQMALLKNSPSVNLQRMKITGDANANLFSRHLTETPRSGMPQLPEDAAGLSEYASFMKSKGIKGRVKEVDPRSLIAAQNELDSVKVATIYDYLAKNKGKLADSGGTLVVSREGGVVDGHHRWAATSAFAVTNPGTKVKVLELDGDIGTLLDHSREFGDMKGIARQGFTAGMTGAGAQAAGYSKLSEPNYVEFGGIPSTPVPDPSKPYMWFDDQWLLIVSDGYDEALY